MSGLVASRGEAARAGGLAGILPVNPVYRDNLDLLRSAVLIESMKSSGWFATLDELVVVAPDKSRTLAECLGAVAGPDGLVRVVSESELFTVDELEAMSHQGGWVRQQLVKLASYRVTAATSVLTLDSDLIAVRACSPGDLKPGALPVQYDRQLPAWTQDSARIVGAITPTRTMGVTPAFLSTSVLQVVMEELSSRDLGWAARLCQEAARGRRWTEYMLYQATAEKHGLWEREHNVEGAHIYGAMWRDSEASEEALERLMSENPMLIVNQSIRGDFDHMQSLLHRLGITSVFDLSSSSFRLIAGALRVHFEGDKFIKKHSLVRRAITNANTRGLLPRHVESLGELADIISQSAAQESASAAVALARESGAQAPEARIGDLFHLANASDAATCIIALHHEELASNGRFIELALSVVGRLVAHGPGDWLPMSKDLLSQSPIAGWAAQVMHTAE